MAYDPPGRADDLPAELVDAWDQVIATTFTGVTEPKTRFFALNFESLTEPELTDTVHWPGDPAEPLFCIDDAAAQELSDWGVRGRHVLHNEYCEYRVISATDSTGKTRPKRVEVTTELREYWLMLAMHDPELVRTKASEVLGREVDFSELYGDIDPLQSNEKDRQLAFCRQVAGHGKDPEMVDAEVPAQPEGALNTERALFMTNPINGLDDLLGIVMFGARPFATEAEGGPAMASRDDIFTFTGRTELACRHADPVAAMAAYGVAFSGGQVAFANPLGMYIRKPNFTVFSVDGDPVPKEWISMDRGDAGMWQRLEFGPGDDDDAFLDDITISIGASERSLAGGYQLVRQLEVGPLVLIGSGDPVAEDEWTIIPAAEPIDCAKATACGGVDRLKAEFDRANGGGQDPDGNGG